MSNPRTLSTKMNCDFGEAFRMRVKHNFKLYVLLTSKTKNWKEDYILDSIYQLNGYKNHKAVKYEINSSHIHIKFDDECSASEAIGYLNGLSADLTAVLVDDMLRDWFSYEMKSGHTPHWTLTIVDITGNPPYNLNFLTEHILNSIFCNFGDPYLLPYTAALNEPHVQVLFGSMTEALAACMAFGEWYYRDVKVDSFFYRVRINPSDKEAMLIRNSGGIPREAFKLDYFVNVRNEVIQNKGYSDKQRTARYKNVQNKANEKIRKHKYNDSQHKHNTHQAAPRTPILCVPVIAPLSSSYAEALTSTKKFNVDFSKTVLNIRRTCSVSTGALVDNDCEIDFHQSIQGERIDQVSRYHDIGRLEQFGSISKQVPLIQDSICSPGKVDLASHNLMDNVATRQGRNISKGLYRGAERRKPKVFFNINKSSELQTAASMEKDC